MTDIDLPWGKLERDAVGQVRAAQSLADHSALVAAAFRAIVALPGLRLRLETAYGSKLDDIQLDRIAYLVYLHDCGKVNAGFQARLDSSKPAIGHIAPLSAVFGTSPDLPTAKRACEILNAERLAAWGHSVPELLDVIFSHHGAPWACDESGARFRHHWQPTKEYDCWSALAGLVAAADAYLPAVDEDALPIAGTPRFLHAIAGLVQLADWIGSAAWNPDCQSAPENGWETRVLERIGLDPRPWRSHLDDLAFRDVFGYAPYAHQIAAGAAPGRLLILESETGSGKTESALWRFLQLFRQGAVDGLYFALPTRTAAAQLHQRVSQFSRAVWGEDAAPHVVLAVPGYLTSDEIGGLPAAADTIDAVEYDTRRFNGWAASHPKRYCASMLGVGTIDQALLSTLLVKHAHLRGSLLMRHLLVVDEVHASDRYMQSLLVQLLEDHLAIGGHAVLLSATLGGIARERLLSAARGERFEQRRVPSLITALATPYPLLCGDGMPASPVEPQRVRERAIQMRVAPQIDDSAAIAEMSLAAARSGAKVLVIRNSVRGAVEVLEAAARLEQPGEVLLHRVRGIPAVHHGRFAREDRVLLDKAVEQAIGRTRSPGGRLVIGTQTLEQSLDIDADLLITDLCPADVLLQRLGRLHRHQTECDGARRARAEGFCTPAATVLVPVDGLRPFLSGRLGSRNRHGLGYVEIANELIGTYQDLTICEATWRLIAKIPEWLIPSTNRLLVEHATHDEALAGLVAELDADGGGLWTAHASRLIGHRIARDQGAAMSVLRRARPFMEQPVRPEEHVTTRLGGDRRIIDLPPGTTGAFGAPVASISVPDWMLPPPDRDATAEVTPRLSDPGFTLRIGSTTLRYDCRGLQQVHQEDRK